MRFNAKSGATPGRATAFAAVLASALACTSCASEQDQPSNVVVLPGLTKTFSQFQADDAACRGQAAQAAGQAAGPAGTPVSPSSSTAPPASSVPGAMSAPPPPGSASGAPGAAAPYGAPSGAAPTAAPTAASATGRQPVPPEQIYASCMTARGNTLQQNTTSSGLATSYDGAGYAYYYPEMAGGAYPTFDDYYPWEYGDTLGYDFWGAPLFFGWGGFGGGYFGGRYWGGHYWPGHYFAGHPWGMYHGARFGGFHGGGFHGGGFHGGGFHGGGGGGGHH